MNDINIEDSEQTLFRKVYNNPASEKEKDFQEYTKQHPNKAMQFKRIIVIKRTLENFLIKLNITGMYSLDTVALGCIVRDYLQDLNILKMRYTSETIQLPKIAGLMTNLIMRYHPVIPINKNKNQYFAINEFFAVYHALCICSDFSNGAELETYSKQLEHREFYKDMTYLLRRNYTAENLIVVFKVLCQDHFKSFKNKDAKG
ncbi:hypothetical protein R80B4_02850 [Fibrobacteres bacterium R8-0-B4]